MPTSCSPAPAEIRFDITDATAPQSTRILLSNTHVTGTTPDYPWPFYQSLLAVPRQIPMGLRVILGGVGTAGIPVLLTLLDPASTARYGFAQPNDNLNTVLPKIVGTGVVDNQNGTYSVDSGANGYIDAHLELATTAMAGDDYRVYAIGTLPDLHTTSATSGRVTVWKRMFLEKRQMFVRGIPLATNVAAGATTIVVPNAGISATNERFARSDYVMLMHAPAYGTAKTAIAFYRRPYQITARPATFTAAAPTAGVGTITTNGTTTIVGAGTRFTRLHPFDVISINSNPQETRIVTAIASDTQVTVDTPTYTAVAGMAYTVGDPNLVPGASYITLTLDHPLTERYQREALAPQQVTMLNDAVVRVASAATNLSPADYLDSDDTFISGTGNPFSDAFVEYILLPQQGGTANPLPRVALLDDETKQLDQQFVDKWFLMSSPVALTQAPAALSDYRYTVVDNHQALLIADTEGTTPSKSSAAGYMTTSTPNEKTSIVERGTIAQRVTDCNSPMWDEPVANIVQKTAAHEVAHQWEPNGIYAAQGHCNGKMTYDGGATGTYCLLCLPTSVPDVTEQRTCNGTFGPVLVGPVEKQYGDNIAKFHFDISTSQSEYVEIRKKLDPWQP